MKLAVTLLITVAVLAGCAAPRPAPRVSAPPPAAVSTAAVRRASATIGTHTAAAQTRTETIIKTVETIRLATDPATAAALGEVQTELFKVSADLRDAQEAKAQLEKEIAAVEKSAGDNRAWGIAQQQAADANAIGWHAEEAAHAKTQASEKHWHDSSNRRGNYLGWLGGAALGFLSLQLMRFLPMPYALALPALGSLAGYFGARWIL